MTRHGPMFIPYGTSMEDIKWDAKEYRDKGFSARIIKTKRKPDPVNRNTHTVWIEVKKK